MDEKQFQDMWNVMRQHNLDLVDDTSSDFKCNICQKILINACVAPCRCMFCLECIKDYLQNDKRKCPGDSQLCDFEEIDFNSDIQVNRMVNKRISKLSVKCPNVGCQSQVELNMIGYHLGKCENQPTSCPYLIIGCEGKKMGIDQMKDHLSIDIGPHTKLLINWIIKSQNETKSMKIDIDKLTTIVENLSKENEEVKERSIRDKEITEKIIREIQRKEKENSTEMKILNEKLTKINDELKAETRLEKESREEIIRELQMKEKENSTEISRLKDKICALKNSNRSMREELDTFNSNKEEQVIIELEKCQKVNFKIGKISQQYDALKTETMAISKSIENILENIDETIFTEIHWTIDNWAERLNNAKNGNEKKTFSDSFFTHKKGFKGCMSMFAAFESKMYIDFHIEKGSFDHLLRWPFDRDLELSLMNPQNGFAYKTVTTRTSILTDDYCRIRLRKPKSERNGSICIFSIPHQEMINHNEISIKLSVKPPSIEMKMK